MQKICRIAEALLKLLRKRDGMLLSLAVTALTNLSLINQGLVEKLWKLEHSLIASSEFS
jgi:hypothetical protein